MKKFRFLCVVLLLALLPAVQPLAQQRTRERVSGQIADSKQLQEAQISCPKDGWKDVWIKLRGRSKYYDGRFVTVKQEVLYVCEEGIPVGYKMREITAMLFERPDEDQTPSSNVKPIEQIIMREDATVRPAQITSMPVPHYPVLAAQNNISGEVVLDVDLLANGMVGMIIPRRSPDRLLTENAIEAARLITFKPATKDGKPISVRREISYDMGPKRSKLASVEGPDPLKPGIGDAVERNKPTKLEWKPVKNASYYLIHFQCSYPQWAPCKEVVSNTNTYSLEYQGLPIRWNVSAVRTDGSIVHSLVWGRFGYKK